MASKNDTKDSTKQEEERRSGSFNFKETMLSWKTSLTSSVKDGIQWFKSTLGIAETPIAVTFDDSETAQKNLPEKVKDISTLMPQTSDTDSQFYNCHSAQ